MLMPVTLTVLTDMKRASTKEISLVPVWQKGSIRRNAPRSMNSANPPHMRIPLCILLKNRTTSISIYDTSLSSSGMDFPSRQPECFSYYTMCGANKKLHPVGAVFYNGFIPFPVPCSSKVLPLRWLQWPPEYHAL